jgi:hypothetical protein
MAGEVLRLRVDHVGAVGELVDEAREGATERSAKRTHNMHERAVVHALRSEREVVHELCSAVQERALGGRPPVQAAEIRLERARACVRVHAHWRAYSTVHEAANDRDLVARNRWRRGAHDGGVVTA